MRLRKLLLALVLLLTLTGYSAEGNMVINSRQGVAPISAECRPDLTQREARSHRGYPVRFLEILARSVFIYTDPFGLMPWNTARQKGIDFLDWFRRPDTTDCEKDGYEGTYVDWVDSLSFQQPGSAEFEFLLGLLTAKDLITKSGSYTWEELKAILKSRKGATDLFSQGGKAANPEVTKVIQEIAKNKNWHPGALDTFENAVINAYRRFGPSGTTPNQTRLIQAIQTAAKNADDFVPR